MTFTGGSGITTTGSGNTVTFAINSDVVTLTGTQTLLNKTLTSPTLNSPTIVSATATTLTYLIVLLYLKVQLLMITKQHLQLRIQQQIEHLHYLIVQVQY